MKYEPSKYFAFLNKKMMQFFDIKQDSTIVKFKNYKYNLGLLILIITSLNLNSQNNIPENWDDQAKQELEKQNYFTELAKGE